jgi:hypothetical protein
MLNPCAKINFSEMPCSSGEKWCIIAKDSYSAAAGLAAANPEKEDRR